MAEILLVWLKSCSKNLFISQSIFPGALLGSCFLNPRCPLSLPFVSLLGAALNAQILLAQIL
jgi:hypothetical protein